MTPIEAYTRGVLRARAAHRHNLCPRCGDLCAVYAGTRLRCRSSECAPR